MKQLALIAAAVALLVVALAVIIGNMFLAPAQERTATVDSAAAAAAAEPVATAPPVRRPVEADDFERGEQITDQRADQVEETKANTRVIINAVNTAGE